MPIDPTVAAVATTVATQAGQQYFQGRSNKKTRDFNLEMYRRQRYDNLADWNMQNEYNLPKNQIKRFKEAGLNPNLIYGNGAAAGGNASPPPANQTKSYEHKAAEFNLGGIADAIMLGQKIQLVQAQTNLEESRRRGQDTKNYVDQSSQFADIENRTKRSDLTTEQIRQISANVSYTYAAMNKLMDQQDLTKEKLEAEVSKLKADKIHVDQMVEILKKEGKLKDWEIKLSYLGLTKADGFLYKLLGALIMGN